MVHFEPRADGVVRFSLRDAAGTDLGPGRGTVSIAGVSRASGGYAGLGVSS